MFDEARLDDPDALERLDTHEALRALATAGSQVRRSVRAAAEAGLDRLADLRPRGVVVVAVGGSAVVGDLFVAELDGPEFCCEGRMPTRSSFS